MRLPKLPVGAASRTNSEPNISRIITKQMPHAAGKKIAAKHGSIIDVAVDLVTVAVTLDCVSKVVLGLIKQVKGAPVQKSIKITSVPAGLRLKVRGPKTIQLIFIYTSDRILTTNAVTSAFN